MITTRVITTNGRMASLKGCVTFLLIALLQKSSVAVKVPKPLDYLVSGLESYGGIDESYAGLMPLSFQDNAEGSLFFWLAMKRASEVKKKSGHKYKSDEKRKDKLLIWLNGGPGCSSILGMMLENGPFRVYLNEEKEAVKYKLKYNPYSWNEVAHVLYLEQPIRTGFSAAAEGAPSIKDESQVAEDVRNFLLSFMTVFPQFHGMDLYISGESYAGFYIPWIAAHIVEKQLVPFAVPYTAGDNAGGSDTSSNGDEVSIGKIKTGLFSGSVRDASKDGLNLMGVAIGNGVMDYYFQEQSYTEYAYSHGLIPLGAKMKIDKDWIACIQKIEREGKALTRGSFGRCDMLSKVLEAAGRPNEYNTATFIGYESMIFPGSAVDTFMQDPVIQELLHVRGFDLPGLNSFTPEGIATSNEGERRSTYYQPAKGWMVCNDDISSSMTADHPTTVVPTLQFLSDATRFVHPPHHTHIDSQRRRGTASDDSTVSNSVNTDSNTIIPLNTNSDSVVDVVSSTGAVRVLLYSGAQDLNCNTLGTLHTLENNYWRNKPWSMAERSLWKHTTTSDDGTTSSSDVAGEYFTMDEIFSFLIVRNSGHLVPMDLPSIALEMIDRFLNSRSFADVPLPSEQFYLEQMAMPVAPLTDINDDDDYSTNAHYQASAATSSSSSSKIKRSKHDKSGAANNSTDAATGTIISEDPVNNSNNNSHLILIILVLISIFMVVILIMQRRCFTTSMLSTVTAHSTTNKYSAIPDQEAATV